MCQWVLWASCTELFTASAFSSLGWSTALGATFAQGLELHFVHWVFALCYVFSPSLPCPFRKPMVPLAKNVLNQFVFFFVFRVGVQAY